MCACVCVHVHVHVCMHACVRACVHVCVGGWVGCFPTFMYVYIPPYHTHSEFQGLFWPMKSSTFQVSCYNIVCMSDFQLGNPLHHNATYSNVVEVHCWHSSYIYKRGRVSLSRLQFGTTYMASDSMYNINCKKSVNLTSHNFHNPCFFIFIDRFS